MSKPKLLITRRWPKAVEEAAREEFDVTLNEKDIPLSVDDMRNALKSYDAISPTVTDILNSKAFDVENVSCKILCNYGVGYSHIDIPSAKNLGICVTNTPDVLSDCTADIAMTLMLMAARRAGEGERELRADKWHGWRPTHMIGAKVTGKTLGIIGFGRIGQAMASRGHFGFGMKINIFSRSQVSAEILEKYNAEQLSSVDALLEESDFVSLHCPGGTSNRHLINASNLAKAKSGLILINTARGEIVDETALADALENNVIKAAGLDVFDGEPKINPILMAASNLVMLPHLGSATKETREEMGFRALENCKAFFKGDTPMDKVA
ncbi:D-glycerate dehydrogenase [Rhodobacteraceae bacterium]|nr:D-glycerate dehydrogenase [Paracoccaceae bacterium]